MHLNLITHWLSKLVQIPSINPDAGDSMAPANQIGEHRMAEFLAKQFAAFGGQVEMEEVLPGRPNVYGWWPGETDLWTAVDVHTDTVGVSQMSDPPFDGRIENGRLWGRGSVDTKATLGIILALLEAVHGGNAKLKHNLLVVGTVSEEIGGHGAQAFQAWSKRHGRHYDQLLVAEPTLCTPVYAHKGVMKLVFNVQGQAAHSAQPHLGKNAITAAAPIIELIEAEHQRLQRAPAGTSLGPATIAVTIIEGGNGHNIIPEQCRITVNRRMVPFEDVEVTIADLCDKVQQVSPLPVELEFGRGLPAFYQAPDSPWIKQLADWSGQAAAVAPYGTNALAYGGLAEEMIIFGPGSIDQAHGAVEWVELSELAKAAEVIGEWLVKS